MSGLFLGSVKQSTDLEIMRHGFLRYLYDLRIDIFGELVQVYIFPVLCGWVLVDNVSQSYSSCTKGDIRISQRAEPQSTGWEGKKAGPPPRRPAQVVPTA
jgi:hypothetical protein